jgi:hypothetical protein
MSRQMLVPLRLLALSTDPVFGQVGEIYINTVTKNLRVHNGTTWIELTPPSTDPTPFYMHTHTFDGDVHTIDIQNQIDFKSLSNPNTPGKVLPEIIGYDGGNPSDNLLTPSFVEESLFDAGLFDGTQEETTELGTGGGGSEDFDAPSLDGGGS